MLKHTLFFVCALALAAVPAGAQVQRVSTPDALSDRPIVKLGLFASKPDGSPSYAAYYTSDFNLEHDNQVYVTPCGMGASSFVSRVPTLAVSEGRSVARLSRA